MNRSLRGASFALLALAPFAYLACSDDDTASSVATGSQDASPPPTHQDDATSPVEDGGGDAAPAPTTATVLALTAKRAPEAGVKVVFYDPAGAVLGTETTDADGKATHTIPKGGAISAVFATTQNELVTILGVEPGDTLTVLDPVRVRNTTFNVTPPPVGTVPLPAGTTSFRLVVGGCRDDGLATTGGLRQMYFTYCEPGSDAPTILLAAVNSNGDVLGTTVTTDVALVAGGTTNVSFAGPWTAPAATDTTTVTNLSSAVPAGIGYHVTDTTYSSGAGTSKASADARHAPVDAGVVSSFQRIYPGATFVQNEFDYFAEQNVSPYALITQAIATRGAPGNATIDFGTSLPAITAVTVSGTSTPSVTWTSAAPLTAAKGLVAQLYWHDDNSETRGAWTIIAPPSATSIAPPAPPADLASAAPPATAVYDSPALVAAVDATFLPSYAAVRASGALMSPTPGLRTGGFTAVVPTLPVDGTLKLTAFGVNGD